MLDGCADELTINTTEGSAFEKYAQEKGYIKAPVQDDEGDNNDDSQTPPAGDGGDSGNTPPAGDGNDGDGDGLSNGGDEPIDGPKFGQINRFA